MGFGNSIYNTFTALIDMHYVPGTPGHLIIYDSVNNKNDENVSFNMKELFSVIFTVLPRVWSLNRARG